MLYPNAELLFELKQLRKRNEILDNLLRRAEALKINHPEWSDIIETVVHREDAGCKE